MVIIPITCEHKIILSQCVPNMAAGTMVGFVIGNFDWLTAVISN